MRSPDAGGAGVITAADASEVAGAAGAAGGSGRNSSAATISALEIARPKAVQSQTDRWLEARAGRAGAGAATVLAAGARGSGWCA
jgi:hypothetical protein